MTTNATYTFDRGETIVIPITDDGADAAEVANIVGRMKRLEEGARNLAADAAVAATFGTYYRAADDTFAKGWNFVVEAVASAGLTAGFYQFNFAVVEDGVDVWKSPAAIIRILEPAV